jgi:hypothetical protein
MQPLPSGGLRSNRGTWAVPTCCLPAVARTLLQALPPESFDPGFLGQDLRTYYFDTPRLALRKARLAGNRYLTVRLRRYHASSTNAFALSAKTEDEKWRQEVDAASADLLQAGSGVTTVLARLLPAHLQARLLELTADVPLVVAACVLARRYAVEDGRDRLTLDVEVATDTGKRLPFAVLEFKSTETAGAPPAALASLPLRPIKLSKFLWATEV